MRASASLIHRTYLDHGIKFKYIRRVKKVIDFSIPYYRNMVTNIHQVMINSRSNQVKFIHADEAVFTFSTFSNKTWSGCYDNIRVFDRKITIKTHAIVAGISED